MNRNIWVISDTHFLHANMLKFLDDNGQPFRGRHFTNQDHCDEFMVENWNQKVKPEDIVWHLGDVFMAPDQDKPKFEKLWFGLNGHKRWTPGNHDDIPYLSGKASNGRYFFEKVEIWKIWPEYDMIMTHVPMQLEGTYEGAHKATYNVHGHIHNNPSPTIRHFNASVENIDYAPIHIEDLAFELKKRNAPRNDPSSWKKTWKANIE